MSLSWICRMEVTRDRAGTETVPPAHLHVRTAPNADAAGDRPAHDRRTKTLRELHRTLEPSRLLRCDLN